MPRQPARKRLIIGSAAFALGTSVMVGGAAAADTSRQRLLPGPGSPSVPHESYQPNRVSAQTTVDQGATRRAATIATQGALLPGTPLSQQISSTQATQDLVGQRLVAVSTFRATPMPSAVYTYFGEASGGACVRRAVIVGATDGTATGTFFDPSGNAPTQTFGVTSSLSANTLTVTSAASATFRDADWDCAWSIVGDANGAGLQQFLAADLTTAYIPKLTISTIDPIQGSYAGQWTTVKLDTRNDGRADAIGTRVTASGSGLKFNRRSIDLGTLEDRSSEYGPTFKVKLSGKKSRKATFTVVSAGGHSDRVTVTIARKPKPSRVKSLSGRYYWGNDARDRTKGWDPRGVMFLDKRWAYVGFPPNGKPSCRKTTKNCKRYTYKNGRVKIGSASGRVSSEGFKLGAVRYSPLTLPRRNAKLSVALQHQDFRGCGSNLYCSTWTETLSLNSSRRFVLTETSIASIGVPGVGTISSRVGPDERGRYEVLSKGRIRFVYDSGKRVTRTIGIELDVRGKANAGGAGVVIGDVNYYRPRWAT